MNVDVLNSKIGPLSLQSRLYIAGFLNIKEYSLKLLSLQRSTRISENHAEHESYDLLLF